VTPPEKAPTPKPAGKSAPNPILAGLKKWAVIRDPANRLESFLIGLFCVSLIALCWHILTFGETPESRIISPVTLPSIPETFGTLSSLWFERGLSTSALWSLGRVAGGFLLAVAIGVPLGVLAGAYRRLNSFIRPLSIFGRNIPVAALIPLTLFWFGIDEAQKVMFIFFASAAFVLFDSTNAVNAVPDKYLDTAYTLGASWRPKHGAIWALATGACYSALFALAYYFISQSSNMFALLPCVVAAVSGFVLGFILWFPIISSQPVRKVLLPLALPDITNNLRLMFGLAFGYIMLAEVINSQYGLGSIINISQREGPRAHIYLCLIFIALLAFTIDRFFFFLQKTFFPYRDMGEQ
jgi:ABC-type nitrate/sulfonate/bicarbonate transport system permease component